MFQRRCDGHDGPIGMLGARKTRYLLLGLPYGSQSLPDVTQVADLRHELGVEPRNDH